MTQESFIKMIRLLLGAKDKLSGAGICVDSKDRLGRTVLHLAAQYGLVDLVNKLVTRETAGGFGADVCIADLIN